MQNRKTSSVFKRTLYIILSVAVIIFIGVMVYAYTIISNAELITLGENESYTMSYREDEFVVRSYHADVITPSYSSTVKASSQGDAIVCVKYSYFDRDFYRFEVVPAPTDITLKKTEVTLEINESYELEPVCDSSGHSFALSFVSSDQNVATVSEDGVVTAKDVGECEITVTSYNGLTAKCNINIIKAVSSVSLLMLDKYDIDTDIKVLTDLPSDIESYDAEISVSDSEVLSIDESNQFLLHPVAKGECEVTVSLPNGVSDSKLITIDDYEKASIDFDILNQFPTLPTGCEVVSLTSVLNFLSFDVSMTTMADEYMPRSTDAYYNINPHEYFIGTPYTWDGFGCYSGCIVKTAENYFNDNSIGDYVAVDISGCSTNELYNYLINGVPVITWVTSSFVTPTNGGSWYVDNELINWCNSEHCLVTTGFDKANDTVTVADDSGGYSYSVSQSRFETVFEGMGSMAVVILKK